MFSRQLKMIQMLLYYHFDYLFVRARTMIYYFSICTIIKAIKIACLTLLIMFLL